MVTHTQLLLSLDLVHKSLVMRRFFDLTSHFIKLTQQSPNYERGPVVRGDARFNLIRQIAQLIGRLTLSFKV